MVMPGFIRYCQRRLDANWYKVNPSLGDTVDIERLRDAYREAKQNPADEITFKWLRMNMWVSSTTSWIPDAIFMKGNEPIDMRLLEGRDCYAGLDLSSTGGNVVIETDAAENIKVTKAKSKEKIDGIVASIMALDRCLRNEGEPQGSVYDERGLLVF